MSYIACGAAIANGWKCARPVKKQGDRCYQHKPKAPLPAEQPHLHGCLYSGRPHPGQSCRFPAGVIFCPKGCGVLEVVEEPNGIACTRCGYCLHKEPAQPTELERGAYPLLRKFQSPASDKWVRIYEEMYPEATRSPHSPS